jgi:glycosyltransferase involved in cell wall biosynthesis
LVTSLILHVLPLDAPRGAQTYARALRGALDSDPVRHRILTLFQSHETGGRADIAAEVPNGRLRSFGFDPRASLRLHTAVRKHRPAAVIVHGGEPLKYAAFAGIPKSQLVYLKIGAGDAQLSGIKRRLHRSFVTRAGNVVVVSRSAAAEVADLGVPPERVVIIPNGRDPALYTPAGARRESTPRLVFVGRLNDPKRPLRFVELVRTLRDSGVAITATIAGDGPLRAEVERESRDLDIEVLGTIENVPELLRRCDVFVFCGAPPEGMPGVLIEAGLAGLPVVTTNVPGAKEVVHDGRTGYIVPIDDFDALVASTRTLAIDRELREQIGATARRETTAQFALAVGVARWKALLDNIVTASCTSST